MKADTGCHPRRRVAWTVGNENSLVSQVTFPFLASHPQHALARRQMKMASGMISFQVNAGREEEVASRFMSELQTIHYAVSLGHHRSLIYLLSTMDLAEREGSSYALEGESLREYREFAGNGVFRFSVGLEDPDDLIEDLARVLRRRSTCCILMKSHTSNCCVYKYAAPSAHHGALVRQRKRAEVILVILRQEGEPEPSGAGTPRGADRKHPGTPKCVLRGPLRVRDITMGRGDLSARGVLRAPRKKKGQKKGG